jgi:DNA gyrase inhibitor GyrI
MTMQFYLPLKFNKDNAPKPSNSDIEILTIEGGYYAVIEYSGRSSDKNFLKNKDILEKLLKQDNITILSPPIRASYNSPFTLPMLKRNEVMYRIDL